LTVVILTAIAFLSHSAATQGQATSLPGTVQGTVRDSNGHVVGDASIDIEGGTSKQETQSTDSKGFYRFALPAKETFTVHARKASVGEARSSVLLQPGETRTIDLQLSPLSSAATPNPEFYDQPSFTVAGITDTMAPGGHGSDRVLRTSEGLAKNVATLDSDSATSPQNSLATEAALRDSVQRKPHDFDPNHALGKFLVETGRPKEAIPYLEQASKVKPGDYNNSYELACAYLRVGEYSKGKIVTSDQLQRQDSSELRHLQAELYEKSGQPLEAVREYQRAAELKPSEPNLFDWGAELLLHRTIQPAIEVFTNGSHAFPDSRRMLIGLGVSQYAAGVYDEAIQSLCRASDLAPNDPIPYSFLQKVQNAASGQSEAIERRMGRFAALQPSNAEAQYSYAVSLWNRRKGSQDRTTLDKVESLLHDAIRLDPKLAAAHQQLGILYSDRKDFSKAISAFRQAIKADPQMEEPHFRLAQIYRQTGDREDADKETMIYQQLAKESNAAAERERRDLPRFVYTLRDQTSR
jgi:tetratricopeptide (TPR) repeat protein